MAAQEMLTLRCSEMPFRSFLRVQFQKSRQEENVERSIRCFYGEYSLQSDL